MPPAAHPPKEQLPLLAPKDSNFINLLNYPKTPISSSYHSSRLHTSKARKTSKVKRTPTPLPPKRGWFGRVKPPSKTTPVPVRAATPKGSHPLDRRDFYNYMQSMEKNIMKSLDLRLSEEAFDNYMQRAVLPVLRSEIADLKNANPPKLLRSPSQSSQKRRAINCGNGEKCPPGLRCINKTCRRYQYF